MVNGEFPTTFATSSVYRWGFRVSCLFSGIDA